MKLALIFFIATLGLSLSASAAEIDVAASSFKWTGKKVTGQHYGKLPVKSSNITEQEGKIVGGEIVLDISKMTVEDLSGEDATKFLNHMKSEDFFNVAEWPTAKLVVESVEGHRASGKLTIKDKTNPVDFRFKKQKDFYTGQLKFDRTKFGMIYGSGNFFKNLGDKMIYNDVTLDFKVKLKKSKLAMQN
jgi:polyisoprenoid-binding protein YceI